MPTSRRNVLQGIAWSAGAGALPFGALAQLREITVADRLQVDLAEHAAFGQKFSGGPGDLATAEWIAGRLRNSGYKVEESEFAVPFFVQRTARLASGSASVAVIPQAPVLPTGPQGVTGRLAVVAGEGRVGNVENRIALVIAPFARHAALFPDQGIGQTVAEAARRGAAAVVIVTTGPSREAVALNAGEEKPFVPVPAAVLAPKHADAFVAAARAGAEATLVVDGDATQRPCKNLIGRVERGPRWIAISTPRSGWFDCVAERGTGTAAFLELADWAVRRFPELSVFVMNTGGHEYFFAGSHRVIGQAPPPADTLVWTHVGATLAARDAEESGGRWVMLDAVDPQRSLMTTDSVRDLAKRAFGGLPGLDEPTPIRAQAGELSTFTDRGYANAFAVIGQHRWFHTVEDTLERVDGKLLVPVLYAHRSLIELVVARHA